MRRGFPSTDKNMETFIVPLQVPMRSQFSFLILSMLGAEGQITTELFRQDDIDLKS